MEHKFILSQIIILRAVVIMLALPIATLVQAQTPTTTAPSGIFDTLIATNGDRVALSSLKVGNPPQNVPAGAPIACTNNAGYFELYYATGCGMEIVNNATHTARRDVMCALFSDISAFITPVNANTKIKVLFDASSTLGGAGAGGAKTFYFTPRQDNLYSATQSKNAVVDNVVWLTINSGIDAYTNITGTLIGTSTFYHMQLAFDFTNYNWHTDLTTTAPSGTLDLYTVGLHEVTHALGFNSLVQNAFAYNIGNSNLYSRFDSRLRTPNTAVPPNQPLYGITGSCAMYPTSFLATSAQINPGNCTSGISNSMVCSTAMQYQFANGNMQAVYTPNCWEAGSSLNHFFAPCMTPPQGQNSYFVLNPIYGGTKRYLKPEERAVLCDVGYSVGTNYGTGNNAYTYLNTSACATAPPIGFNDGITSSNNYQFAVIGTGANLTVDLPGAAILGNDYNPGGVITYECMESVYGLGSVSSNIGNINSTNVYTANANTLGLDLLRYVPVVNNVRGNITYVYVYVNTKQPVCTIAPCTGYVANGNFEITSPQSNLCVSDIRYDPRVPCWTHYSASADLTGSGCPNTLLGVPTNQITPAPSNANASSNHSILLVAECDYYNGSAAPIVGWEESVQGLLNLPLLQNTNYSLQLRALYQRFESPAGIPAATVPNIWHNNIIDPMPVVICGYTNASFIGPTANFLYDPSAPGLVPLCTLYVSKMGNPASWQVLNATFTTPNLGGQTIKGIVVGVNAPNKPYAYRATVLADDIQIYPQTASIPSLTLPQCTNYIANLNNYLINPQLGGTFSGPGVTGSTFDGSLTALTTVVITYTWTDNNGCVNTISGTIQNTPAVTTLSLSPSSINLCSGVNSTVPTTNATNPQYYVNGTLTSLPLTFTTAGIYTITVVQTGSTCSASAVLTVTGLNAPINNLTLTTNTPCLVSTATLTASVGANSGTISGYTFTPAAFVVGPNSGLSNTATINHVGVFTVTVANTGGCSATATVVQSSNFICTGTGSATLATSYSSAPAANVNGFNFGNQVTLSGTFTLTNMEIVATTSTAEIIIAANANITMSNVHISSCGGMWKGIKILPGGKLKMLGNCWIQDATRGVEVISLGAATTNIIDIQNCVFNKCHTSLYLKDYTHIGSNLPFLISKNIFTCRNFSTIIGCSSTPAYPTVSQLQTQTGQMDNLNSPYLLLGATKTLLNNGGDKTLQHIYVEGVGRTTGTSLTNAVLVNHLNLPCGSGSTLTIFDNAWYGVNALASNIRVIGGVFQGMRKGSTGSAGWGVYTEQSAGATSSPFAQFRTEVFDPATFYDCKTGVQTMNMLESHITNCKFYSATNTTTDPFAGVYVRSRNSRLNNINSNFIYNQNVGITLINNIGGLGANNFSLGTSNINQNNIAAKPTGNSSANRFIGQAISCSVLGVVGVGFTNAFTSPRLNINNNTLTDVFNGITVRGYKSINSHLATAQSNTITIALNRNAAVQTGIQFSDNQNIYCRSNVVTGPPLFPSGTSPFANTYNVLQFNATLAPAISNYLFAQNSANANANTCIVTCNQSLGGCYGYEFAQSQTSLNWFPLNEIKNQHYYGLLLSNGATLAKQQMNNAGGNIDNTFDFTAGNNLNLKHTFVKSSPTPNQTVSGITVKQVATYVPTVNDASPANNLYSTAGLSPGIAIVSAANAIAPTCTPQPAPPALAISIGSINVINGILDGSIAFTTGYSVEHPYIAKYNIFEALKADNSWQNASTTIQNFYNTSNATTHQYRKIWDMEEALSQGNYTTATSLANSFVPTNAIETNYKNYTLVAASILGSGNLDASNKTSLKTIALACPHTKGNIVYAARTLYNTSFVDDYTIFEDNCDGSGLYKMAPDAVAKAFEVNVYPNPADATLNIATDFTRSKQLQINLYSMQGALLYTGSHTNNTGILQIDIANLAAGTYLLKITNELHEYISKEIIVQ
jgi:hypothetical protein